MTEEFPIRNVTSRTAAKLTQRLAIADSFSRTMTLFHSLLMMSLARYPAEFTDLVPQVQYRDCGQSDHCVRSLLPVRQGP